VFFSLRVFWTCVHSGDTGKRSAWGAHERMSSLDLSNVIPVPPPCLLEWFCLFFLFMSCESASGLCESVVSLVHFRHVGFRIVFRLAGHFLFPPVPFTFEAFPPPAVLVDLALASFSLSWELRIFIPMFSAAGRGGYRHSVLTSPYSPFVFPPVRLYFMWTRSFWFPF